MGGRQGAVEGVVNDVMNTASFRPSTSFWRGKRVLVTGHTGFKGSWMTLWLANLGAEVHGLSLPPETRPNMFDLAGVAGVCRHRVADVRDAESVRAAVLAADPQIVIHMAAQALVRRSYREPMATYATNVMGTLHVLEACRGLAELKSVVVVTTDKCYENREWKYAYREVDRLGGRDPYSNSKACAELVAQSYRDSFYSRGAGSEWSCPLASARAGNVFGGGDWSEDRLLPDAARAFVAGRPLVIRSPDSVRPWQHVLEPVAGYLMLARALFDRGQDVGDAFNFGPSPDQELRVRDVADGFVAAWGQGARWLHEPPQNPPHEAGLLMLDPSRARQQLGWKPKLSIDVALTMTADWYKLAATTPSPEKLAAFTRSQIDAYAGG